MSKFNQELANNFQLESDGTKLSVNANVRNMNLVSFVTSIVVMHGADDNGKFDPKNQTYQRQLQPKVLVIFGSDAEMEANFKKLKDEPSDEQLAAYYDLVSNNVGEKAKSTVPADLPALIELLAPKAEQATETPSETPAPETPAAETTKVVATDVEQAATATEIAAEVNQAVADAAEAVVAETVVATEQISPEVLEQIQSQVVAEASATIQEQAAERGVEISKENATALAQTALPIEKLEAFVNAHKAGVQAAQDNLIAQTGQTNAALDLMLELLKNQEAARRQIAELTA